jgi:lysophospholipase L1-like esterase
MKTCSHALLVSAALFAGSVFAQPAPTPPAVTPASPAATPAAGRGAPVPAYEAAPRTDANSLKAHEQLLAKTKAGKIDVYVEGDSIARRWGATDYPQFLEHWKQTFHGWNVADFGWGADTTQNIIWRLQNGELDGVNPKVIVLLAGTNNIGQRVPDDAKIEEVTKGLKRIIEIFREKVPAATIIVTAIFPRNDNPAVVPGIYRINANLAKMADGKKIRYLDVNAKLADKDGLLVEGMMGDKLHPTLKGYQVWADGLIPILTELLGPRAATDQAPPPTGDPSAQQKK